MSEAEQPSAEPILATIVGSDSGGTAPPPGTQPPTTPFARELPSETPDPPPRWRELLGVILLVAICDVTIYHGNGPSGFALLFAAYPLLFWFASNRPRWGRWVLGTGLLLLVLAARLVWLGTAGNVAFGFGLLVAFTLAVSGMRPFVPDVFVRAAQTASAGPLGLVAYGRWLVGRTWSRAGPRISRGSWLSVILPLVALGAFSLLFLLANPDLFTSFSEGLEDFFAKLESWLENWSPEFGEIVFCGAALWISVGLLRPMLRQPVWPADPDEADGICKQPVEKSSLYSACRNTLLTVIVLFVVYLIFEFTTLWFREFPVGFYYAGYAHQGAAWLTVALALSTAILSLIFRGGVLRDPRLAGLRGLAWIWSLENLVLAVAVYNRMGIYIRFNGLTQMRMVGLFGISVVVVGFLLVVWKIARNRGFHWLIQTQLWALALTVFLYGVTPIDTIVFRHNVSRVLAGDLAPSVQISVQSINAEGLPELLPLLKCRNALIRDGVRALLSLRAEQAEQDAAIRRQHGWSAFQWAEQRTLDRLRANRGQWSDYRDDPQQRTWMIARFDNYVYQWY